MFYPLGLRNNLKPFGISQLDVVVILLIKFCLTHLDILKNTPEITLALIECRH